MKTILITGASSGIGRATALKLDKNNHHLILCGRRQERLLELQSQLKDASSQTLNFDVKDKNAVISALNEISNLDILINNAGNAHGLAPFDEMDIEDMEEMILGNVLGLIYVSKYSIEKLKNGTNPIIINISSIAGKETYANGTVYCASKSAVEELSKGLRLDLQKHGIRVCNIAPGAVHTEFSLVRFRGDEIKAENVYKGFVALQAEDIANTIEFVINTPHHVQISDITILPKAQASATSILKI